MRGNTRYMQTAFIGGVGRTVVLVVFTTLHDHAIDSSAPLLGGGAAAGRSLFNQANVWNPTSLYKEKKDPFLSSYRALAFRDIDLKPSRGDRPWSNLDELRIKS